MVRCLLAALPLLALPMVALPLPCQEAVVLPPGLDGDAVAAHAGAVRPSARQLAWQQLGFLAFVHFGMNTFTDREWGDGTESPATFAPSAFDAGQWAAAFAAAGMRGVVLTCKHHDGFCLWPTASTTHSVAASPWHGGRGDVVGAVAAACRRHGLAFGVYLSPWDRHARTFGTAAYQQVFQTQLRELCSSYGPLCEVWFDGAHCPPDDPALFDWQACFRLVRELQPDAVIAVTGPDVRWVGNELGRPRAHEWSVLPLDTDDPGPFETSRAAWQALWRLRQRNQQDDLGSRAQLANARRLVFWPAEVDVSIRPGWFHHAHEDQQVKSRSALLDLWFGAVGGNAVLLLNVPPDRTGRLPAPDVAVLRELGDHLRLTFQRDLAADALRKTFERAGEVYFRDERTVDVIELREDLASAGQRIEAFRIDSWDGEQWRELARGSTVGFRRLLRLPPTRARGFRYWIEAARGRPVIAQFSLWRQPIWLEPPGITRDRDGNVAIATDLAGVHLHYTLDGARPDGRSRRYEKPFALPRGGTVRAVAVAAEPGATTLAPRTDSVASALFGLLPRDWTLLDCSSEQAPQHAATLAFDGDPHTYWCSGDGGGTPPPHHLTIDLGAISTIAGFVYVPRHDADLGTVADYAFEVRGQDTAWRLVAAGTFDHADGPTEPRIVRLREPLPEVRAIRFTARREIRDRAVAACAELAVLAADPDPPAAK